MKSSISPGIWGYKITLAHTLLKNSYIFSEKFRDLGTDGDGQETAG
jgi:hypothetical protein